MLKKNTRKRLLAGALATVMMLTMCPSWALADVEDGIAPLPANEEIAVPVDDSTSTVVDSTLAADPKTPADSTPSETEAKSAENQNTAPAPSEGGANGGTDSTESGNNNASSDVSEDSKNNSQNNDAVSNSPEDEINTASLDIDLARNQYQQKEAKYFVLLPNRGKPNDNADQGQINYLPSSYDKKTGTKGSDGGVQGLDASTGYPGSVTKEGMQALAEEGGSITNIENGVPAEYLGKPTDLGFFNPDKWDEHGNYNGTGNPATILGENFNGKDIEIVWYTIKDQREWDVWHWVGDIHVDGYVKNVVINVTYHSNFGTDEIFNDRAKTGDKYEALKYEQTDLSPRANYKFVGWCTDRECNKPYTKDTLMTSKDLYAKWEPIKYKVTWKSEGETLATQTVDYNSTLNNAPSDRAIKAPDDRYTYEFAGWKREGTKDTELVDLNTTKVTEDVTYVAVFTPVAREYTVTYKVDDKIYTINGVEQVFHYHYDDPVALAAKPTRDGFNFNGWLPEGVALNATGTGFQMPAHNVVIRGTFDANSFYVAYYVDGILYASELYKTGENVTIRGDLAKDGFTFSGWTRDNVKAENFDMPAHNVEIHGSYRQNKHNYTINKHFYDEKGAEVKVAGKPEAKPGNEYALISELYKKDAVNQTVDGKNYVYVSALTTVTPAGETLTKDVTIDLYYYLNVEGDNDIPDAWEHRLTFKVVNGSWNDGSSADIVVYVPFKDKKTGEAFEAKNVVVPVTRIPDVGEKPNSGYHAGAWDTSPYDNYKVQKDTVFTYTYEKDSSGGSSGGHHRRPTVTIPDDVPTGLNGDDHYAYIVGYPDKTVRPQNGITRAEVATIFFRLLTDETRDANSTKSNSYSDVAAGAWYNHAVSTLSAMGIVKGDSDGKFNPNAPITRAEFAAIAARFDDKANTTTADFSDIASHWAKNEISAASNNGWINGYPDGTFRPDNKITRAEAMTLVNRVLKRLPETAEDLHDDMIKWSDNSDASQWFYLAVQEATNSHYYQTKENQFEKWSELRDTRDWTELEK